MYNLKLGYGSFLTMDFGRQIQVITRTKRGEKLSTRGEWHIWIYMCSWRIDKNKTPLVGSNDSREKIELALQKANNKKLLKYEILNDSLDAIFHFENKVTLSLFNTNTEEGEHWLLFTPDKNVLTIGPSNSISYGPSS